MYRLINSSYDSLFISLVVIIAVVIPEIAAIAAMAQVIADTFQNAGIGGAAYKDNTVYTGGIVHISRTNACQQHIKVQGKRSEQI